MIPEMQSNERAELRDLGAALAAELPRVRVKVTAAGIELASGGRIARIPTRSTGRIPPAERAARRAAGENYVDTGVGEVFVESPDLLLFVRIGRTRARLTPQQCAVLAAVLEAEELEGFESDLGARPGDLRRGLERRVGIRLTPAAITKLTRALDATGLRVGRRLSAVGMIDAILEQFRLHSVTRLRRVPAPPSGVIEWVRNEIAPARLVRGLSAVIAEETGYTVEPPDVLLEETIATDLVRSLGGSVADDFRGPSLLIRSATRLPLDQLAPRGDRLLVLLAAAEGLRADSAVVVDASTRIAETWRSRWK